MFRIKLIVILLFTILSVNARGQKLEIAAKAGLNISNFNTSLKDKYTFNTKQNIVAGLSVDYFLTDKIIFASGLYFSPRGSEIDDEVNVSNTSITTTLDYQQNYIDIPLLIKVQPIEYVNLFVGPQLSIKLSDDFTFSDSSPDVTLTHLWSYEAEPIDYGLVFGIGSKFKKFTFDIQYTLGFTEYVKATNNSSGPSISPDDDFFNNDFKNSNLRFTLGYILFSK